MHLCGGEGGPIEVEVDSPHGEGARGDLAILLLLSLRKDFQDAHVYFCARRLAWHLLEREEGRDGHLDYSLVAFTFDDLFRFACNGNTSIRQRRRWRNVVSSRICPVIVLSH